MRVNHSWTRVYTELDLDSEVSKSQKFDALARMPTVNADRKKFEMRLQPTADGLTVAVSGARPFTQCHVIHA